MQTHLDRVRWSSVSVRGAGIHVGSEPGTGICTLIGSSLVLQSHLGQSMSGHTGPAEGFSQACGLGSIVGSNNTESLA